MKTSTVMGRLSFHMKTEPPMTATAQDEPDLGLWCHLVRGIKMYLENDPVFRYSVAVTVISIVLVTYWMVSRCVRRRSSTEGVMLEGVPAKDLFELLEENIKKLQNIAEMLKMQNAVAEEAPALLPPMKAIAVSEEVRPSIMEEIKNVPKKSIATRKTTGQVRKTSALKK